MKRQVKELISCAVKSRCVNMNARVTMDDRYMAVLSVALLERDLLKASRMRAKNIPLFFSRSSVPLSSDPCSSVPNRQASPPRLVGFSLPGILVLSEELLGISRRNGYPRRLAPVRLVAHCTGERPLKL